MDITLTLPVGYSERYVHVASKIGESVFVSEPVDLLTYKAGILG